MENNTSADPTLESLVRSLNLVQDKTGEEATEGITLAVGGLLISGIIISEREYRKSVTLLSELDGIFPSGGAAVGVELSGPQYIHLKGARIILGGQDRIPTGTSGILWRARLDRVDGFCLGRIGS